MAKVIAAGLCLLVVLVLASSCSSGDSASELPIEITRFGLIAPEGTKYRADAAGSQVEPEVLQLAFVLSEIPENLSEWQFGVFAE